MKNPSKFVIALAVLCAAQATGAAAKNETSVGYFWLAELAGPTQKCRVPNRIRFVVADAIIGGGIKFAQKAYFPKGRFEDSFDVELSLVRFYGDPRPLVSLAAKANGTWNGKWTSQKKNCTGKVRVKPRE